MRATRENKGMHVNACRSTARRRALTLVECLMASAILSGAVLATSSVAMVARQHLREGAGETNAVRLARDLMEEISARHYLDPQVADVGGPEPGEATRSSFNDVNDFNGYTDGPSGIVDGAGAAYPPEVQGFNRSVVVTPGTSVLPSIGASITGQTVTVTVQRNGRTWSFTRFIPQPLVN